MPDSKKKKTVRRLRHRARFSLAEGTRGEGVKANVLTPIAAEGGREAG